MAVAFVVDSSGLGSAQNPTFSITVSGTNPALTVKVGLDSTTATVSSVSWSLGSGTPGEVANIRSGTAFGSTSAIPAPTGGAGTVTVNKSAASINHQVDIGCFSGADQTTPCPAGDAQTSTSNLGITQTPTNLTANDATDGAGVNTVAGNPLGVSPNSRYLDTTTSVNMEAGDAGGTTGVTYTDLSGSGASTARIAVRIAAATAVSVGPNLNIGFRAGRGVSAGPAMRRMMPQKFPVPLPPATETTQSPATFTRSGRGPGVGPPGRRLPQIFADTFPVITETTQSPAVLLRRGPGFGPSLRRQFPQVFPPLPVAGVTVALTGASATFTPGTLGVTHTQALTGSAITSTAGTVIPGLSKALTGVVGTFNTGSLLSAISILLGGSRATFSSGVLTPSGGVSPVTPPADTGGGRWYGYYPTPEEKQELEREIRVVVRQKKSLEKQLSFAPNRQDLYYLVDRLNETQKRLNALTTEYVYLMESWKTYRSALDEEEEEFLLFISSNL